MSPTLWLESFFLALLRASWQASVLIVLVLVLRWGLRKAMPPEWRSWFWMLVLVRLALPVSLESPLSIFNYSTLKVPVALHESTPLSPQSAQPYPEGALEMQAQAVNPALDRDSYATGGAVTQSSAPEAPQVRSVSPKAILAGVWCLGVLVLALRVFLGHRRLARRLRDNPASTNPMLLEMLYGCAQELGLRRSPALIETDIVCSPAIFGMLWPKLLLPSSATTALTRPQLRCVMLHETEETCRKSMNTCSLRNRCLDG